MHRGRLIFILILFSFFTAAQGQTDASVEKTRELLDERLDALDSIPLHSHELLLKKTSELLPIAEQINDTNSILYLLSIKASAYYFSGKTDSAILYYKQVAEIDSAQGDIENFAIDRNNIAVVYDMMGKLDKAANYYEANLETYTSIDDTVGLATTYLNLASVNHEKGYTEVALDNYFQAEKLFTSVGDSSLVSQVRMNIGTIYSSLGTYKKAEEHFKQTISYSKRSKKDSITLATALLNLGGSLLEQDRTQEAITTFRDALQIAQELNLPSLLGEIYLGQSMAQEKYNLYQSAQEKADSALAIAQRINEVSMEVGAWLQKAVIIKKLNDYDTSLEYILKAEEIARESRLAQDLPEILESKAQLLEKMNRKEEAYEALVEYRVMKDSMLTQQLFTKLAELEYHHKLKEEEKKNKELRQRNEIQKLEIERINRKNLVRFTIGLSLLIILGGLFYFRRRNERKNRELKLKQGELEFTIERLKQQQNKQQAILSILPDSVFILDKVGNYRSIEQHYDSLLFRIFKKQKTKNIFDLLPENTGDKLNKALIELDHGSSLEIFDFSIHDGREMRTFESRVVRINHDNYLAITRDRTQERNNTEEIEESRKELAEASKAKDQFLSILAHDLRGPFNALLGFSSILYDDYDSYNDDERHQYVRQIYKSSEQLFHLLVNLLHWTRMQTGKVQYSPHEQDIIKSIKGAVAEIEQIAAEKEIRIEKDLPDSYNLKHDSSMIHGAVLNLLSNAIKYSNRNSSVYLKASERNGTFNIHVKDEGTGIEIKNTEELFRIDRQFKQPGTESENGTGLGLILCKEFINRHGGYILVDTQPGQGSTFTIHIPVEE